MEKKARFNPIVGDCFALFNSLVYKSLSFILCLILFSGCFFQKGFIDVKVKETMKSLGISVANIKVENRQIIITGSNLSKVKNFQVKEGASTILLQIESNNGNQIVANTTSDALFAAGKLLDFIFSNANAAATYNVNFSLCDSLLGGKGFNCSIAPNDKEVLSYDSASQKWKPRAVNGLKYVGAWDANADSGVLPSTTGLDTGDYYIVSTDHGIYFTGDWIVFNGTVFDRIDNSQAIVSVFGRTGVVSANEGDYNLNKMSDVDLATTPPTNGQYLTFNGSNWVPGTINLTESDPTVQAYAKLALPTCNAGEVLKSNGATFSCVTDNAGAGSFSGTANRAVVTNGSGALAVSAITDTVLGYLSGATSNIQGQLNNKLDSTSFIDWSTSGMQTIDPTRINLTTANRVLVTNGTSNPAASSVTSTELGYLSGVTSNLQTQLGDKADLTNIAQTITALTVTGLQAPSVGSDAVNKTYVDARTSQWTTTGSDIYYNTGKVGIGTTGPGSTLSVAGTASIGIPSSFDYASPRFSVTSGCNGCGGNYIGQSIVVTGPTTSLQGLNISASQPINGGPSAGPMTAYGINSNVSSIKQITSGTSTLYGSYTSASSTGATGGTINTYGSDISVTGDTGGTSTAYGTRVAVTGADTNYGVYSSTTAATGTTAYGLYVDGGTGPGTEYAAAFMNGNVGIGTTTPANLLHVYTSTAGSTVANFESGTGSCTVTPNTGMSCSSDERLKENIEVIPDALEKILNTRGVTFQWKEHRKSDFSRHMGFIAQEVEKVAPELVTEDKRGYKQVNYANFVSILVEGVKEVYARMMAYFSKNEVEIAALKNENAQIKAENAQMKTENAEIKTWLCTKDPLAPFCRK